MLIGAESVVPGARKALAAAEAASDRANQRERGHIAALAAWTEGRLLDAAGHWEHILLDHPRDLLALRLHHFNAFWLGRADLLRDVPASVLPAYEPTMPGYGNVLGMLAFGLEECGDSRRAEPLGREAVERSAEDLWAVHAVAHVLEAEERHAEGIAWLDYPMDRWADRNPFKDHLWWHKALHAVELGDDRQVLALYDEAIRVDPAGFYLDIQNAASLLFRLRLLGVDVGDRWQPLAEVAAERIGDRVQAFTDAHVMLALAAAGRFDQARTLLGNIEAVAEDQARHPDYPARIAAGLCRAILAACEGRPKAALDELLPIRHRLGAIGGSHAQRDVFAQLLIEVARQAGAEALARSLMAERRTLKPESRLLLEPFARH
jgi:tetratricopeptide (TPR) repeat protein